MGSPTGPSLMRGSGGKRFGGRWSTSYAAPPARPWPPPAPPVARPFTPAPAAPGPQLWLIDGCEEMLDRQRAAAAPRSLEGPVVYDGMASRRTPPKSEVG